AEAVVSLHELHADSRVHLALRGLFRGDPVHDYGLAFHRLPAGELERNVHHRVHLGRLLGADEQAAGADVGRVFAPELVDGAEAPREWGSVAGSRPPILGPGGLLHQADRARDARTVHLLGDEVRPEAHRTLPTRPAPHLRLHLYRPFVGE